MIARTAPSGALAPRRLPGLLVPTFSRLLRPPADRPKHRCPRPAHGRRDLLGATRIHGELLKLGSTVSERTVSRLLKLLPRPSGSGRQTWSTFLRNHRAGIAAMDLVTVPTATFRFLYALVIVRHGRRDVVRFSVTSRPNAAWIVQQLREAFPFDSRLAS